MKKLLASLLLASSLCLAGCSSTESCSSASGKLRSGGYTVQTYTQAEAKAHLSAFNFEGVDLTDALIAKKGSDENQDYMLAFFFSSIDQASAFVNKNQYENLATLNSVLDKELGSGYTRRVGTHNNVALCTSETAFSVAF